MNSAAIHTTEYPSSQVVLVLPTISSSDLSNFAESCTGALRDIGLNVAVADWDTVDDWSGKLLLSFLVFDGPMLMDMSESLFVAVKAMSLRSVGMLLVTRAGLTSAPHPGYIVSLGFLRTLRSEDENIRLMSVDLSPDTDLSSILATNKRNNVWFGLNAAPK